MEGDHQVNGQNGQGSCMSVSVPLLPCKLWWLLLDSSAAVILMFRNPFLISVGLSARQTGLISAISYIAGGLSAPCWGFIADKTGRRRSIMIFLCVNFVGVIFSIPWVGRLLQSEKEDTASKTLFYSMLGLWVLAFSFISPLDGLLKSAVMNVLQHNPSSQGYGDQLVYGTIGFGVFTFVAGLFADRLDLPSFPKYSIAFFLAVPLMIPLIPLTFALFKYTEWDELSGSGGHSARVSASGFGKKQCSQPDKVAICDADEILANRHVVPHVNRIRDVENEWENGQDRNVICGNQKSKVKDSHHEVVDQVIVNPIITRAQAMRKILTTGRVLVILATCFVVGLIFATFASFFFLTVKDEMDGSKTSMGLVILAMNIVAAITFYFTDRLIEVFGNSVVLCVEISVLSWIVRLVSTSYIKNVWWSILPQLLHGLGWSLFRAATVQYIHQVAPLSVHSTMFTLASSLQNYVCGFVANIGGGAIYQAYKGPVLFRAAAGLAAFWLFVMVLFFHFVPWLKQCACKEKSRKMPRTDA